MLVLSVICFFKPPAFKKYIYLQQCCISKLVNESGCSTCLTSGKMISAHIQYIAIGDIALGRDQFCMLDRKVAEVVNHGGILIRPCCNSN